MFDNLLELIENSAYDSVSMALFFDKLGPKTSLYLDASIYSSSLVADIIAETFTEDGGNVLKAQRDLAVFRALYECRVNAILKALNAPSGQAQ